MTLRHWVRALAFAVSIATMAASARADAYTDFFRAVKQDNAAAVQRLLQRGFDPNTVDPTGQPALIVALNEPAPRVVQALVAAPGLKPETRNAKDESPLMIAAIRGQFDAVVALIARDADVNKTGWTPLHYAASAEGPEQARIVAKLLEHHAFIDAESPNGTTPLMMAAHYGSREVVQLLLAEGADPTMRNQQRLSAADFALRADRRDLAEQLARAARTKQPRGQW